MELLYDVFLIVKFLTQFTIALIRSPIKLHFIQYINPKVTALYRYGMSKAYPGRPFQDFLCLRIVMSMGLCLSKLQNLRKVVNELRNFWQTRDVKFSY